MMKPLDIYMKGVIKTLVDDGDELFNRETRHFPPIQYMLPSKRWLRQKYVRSMIPIFSRPYGDEHHIPPHYVIMNKGNFTPQSEKEISKTIMVNRHQIAVPMKMFFRENDLGICSQWEFIRMYCKMVPKPIRKEQGVVSALCLALEMGWYSEMKSLFYDLKKDNPDEYDRRFQNYIDKEKELKRQMKECQNLISVIRLNKQYGWNDRWEELYNKYSESKDQDKNSFFKFCEILFGDDDRLWAVFWDINRIGSDARRIAALSSKYDKLRAKYLQTKYDKESFLMYYTFEM